jgi:transcriptional regulator GlxA family with amidase domain
MDRREFLGAGAAAALLAAAGKSANAEAGHAGKLDPGKGRIPVAVAISEGVTVIDFSGPWEVFQDAHLPERGAMEDQMPFDLFTVSESTAPLRGSAGLRLVPDHTFASAPAPRVIVVPAQRGSPALHEWLRKASRTAGLLAGLEATTHHEAIDRLASQFPDVKVRRGLRFVENAKISTAGGLTSGIDLALRVVERYFGRPAAERTAAYMEYQSRGWVV